MLKALIALAFVIMVSSLAAGAGFLLHDDSRSKRVLVSLKLRVATASILLVLLVYGFYFGDLAAG
ncbi:DUF2909 domain-containing protein [Aidingimonas halophila]|uniref:DUF2909 domain-containing protein n=1 Tax=Aidingimonas halophila TaxID=574349 RepID=A0A1H3BYD1_9GAMM|nr:DUF2909 domain-containing protein [Aidingimonas halophila]GHC27327.1 hypothetical protein GCM10008094_18670 [Aidingimonas halophila]SDX46900.1 Protein of unknown function [Aidingimonas halophila]